MNNDQVARLRVGRVATVRWTVPYPTSPRYGTAQRVRGRVTDVTPDAVYVLEGAHEDTRAVDAEATRIIPAAAVTAVTVHHRRQR